MEVGLSPSTEPEDEQTHASALINISAQLCQSTTNQIGKKGSQTMQTFFLRCSLSGIQAKCLCPWKM
jgi:hypothetical protein